MFPTLFFNVFTVFLMMLPGYLLIRKNIIKVETLRDFSQVIVKVLYPCLIFSSISSNFTLSEVLKAWQLPTSVFLFFVLGLLIGYMILKIVKVKDPARKKSILYQFTINNYSFLPLAIIAKLYNDQYVAALIFSTLGAELAVWTIGMAILNQQQKGFRWKNLTQLFSPPLIGIYSSLVLLAFLYWRGMSINDIIDSSIVNGYLYKTITQIGQATVPMSLLMVGGRIAKINWVDLTQYDIWYVTLFRLIIIPFIGVLVLKFFLPDHPFINVLLIVFVMPTSVASIVFGELFGADQKLMGGTVLVSHLIALLTIPLWLVWLF